jgi:hypothetical protein
MISIPFLSDSSCPVPMAREFPPSDGAFPPTFLQMHQSEYKRSTSLPEINPRDIVASREYSEQESRLTS